ncbi:MAG TPA: RND transporter, partial [Acidobacteriaceae bacterium]
MTLPLQPSAGRRAVRLAGVLTLAGTLLATGCVVGPNYHRPTAPVPPAYSETPPPPPPNGTWTTAAPADAALRGDWWTIFHDDELTRLESQVKPANQTLQAAIERYANARAVVRQARADYFPTLAAGPNIQRERLSYNRP